MWKQIFKTTLIAGSLDITAACIHAWLVNGTTPQTVLKYVASGLLGKEAFNGSYGTMAAGLFFHFLIAFACTAFFFLLYPKLKILHHKVLLNSILIGLIAWTVTTQLIIPASKIQPRPFDIKKASIAAGILVVCIGLPVAISAKRFFIKKSSSRA